jgi:hypothetical protein
MLDLDIYKEKLKSICSVPQYLKDVKEADGITIAFDKCYHKYLDELENIAYTSLKSYEVLRQLILYRVYGNSIKFIKYRDETLL